MTDTKTLATVFRAAADAVKPGTIIQTMYGPMPRYEDDMWRILNAIATIYEITKTTDFCKLCDNTGRVFNGNVEYQFCARCGRTAINNLQRS